ncbi:transposase [Bradyrhizobium sp. SSUT112]|uniref:IS66 family transposase n=1 Tax=Bradyrhizobium sp. SSUT112 TaxID=3040604 RepID=UPI002446BB20|nr:transposase [Bradyrhizobium sp. SSUT112]MDH2357704.1 transposase [Bradyrhizobium sp. SSUT112]
MVRIAEDRSRRLDVTPAQYRVVEAVRPRYVCATGCTGVRQAPAPAHLVEGGLPTEAMLAQVAVSKFNEHMPLYRQSQVPARHRILIDRAVLADWMGTVAFHFAALVERISVVMKQSGRLLMDETRAPVADPGRGHGGADPPIVVYHFAPGRSGKHAEHILDGFDGTLQVDGYQTYHRLARPERQGGALLRLAAPLQAREHCRDSESRLTQSGSRSSRASSRSTQWRRRSVAPTPPPTKGAQRTSRLLVAN